MGHKKEIIICLGSSCFARGNKVTVNIVKSYLIQKGIDVDIVFKGQLCTNLCNKGPVIIINGETFNEVSKDNIIEILDKTLL